MKIIGRGCAGFKAARSGKPAIGRMIFGITALPMREGMSGESVAESPAAIISHTLHRASADSKEKEEEAWKSVMRPPGFPIGRKFCEN